MINALKRLSALVSSKAPQPHHARHMFLDVRKKDDPDGVVSAAMLASGAITVGKRNKSYTSANPPGLLAGSNVSIHGWYFGAVNAGAAYRADASIDADGVYVFAVVPGSARTRQKGQKPGADGIAGTRVRIGKVEIFMPGYGSLRSIQFEGNVLYGGDKVFLQTNASLAAFSEKP